MLSVPHKSFLTPILGIVCFIAGFALLAPGTMPDTQVPLPGTPYRIVNANDPFGDDLDHATTITPGQVVRGVIDRGGDIDVFKFTVEPDKIVHLSLASKSLSGTMLFLHDSNGNVIDETYAGIWNWDDHPFLDGYPERLLWLAQDGGEYYVSVFNRISRDLGRYKLSFEVSDRIDDHGDDISTATPISIEDNPDAVINWKKDIDFFRVPAVKGQGYRIQLRAGTIHRVDARLVDPDGRTIVRTDWNIDHILWRAPETSHYFIAVSSSWNGTYTFDISLTDYRLDLIPESPSQSNQPPDQHQEIPDDHTDTASGATSVSIGDENSFNFHDREDVDWFMFNAEAGKSYIVSVSGNDAAIETQILDIDGNVLASVRDYDVYRSRVLFAPPRLGEYYIRLAPFHRTGEYTLRVEPNDTGATDVATEISLGQIVKGDRLLKFKANARTAYEIFFLDPIYNLSLALYTPESIDFLESRYNGTPPYFLEPAPFRWQAQTTGDHYLQAFQTGEARYLIRALESDYTDDHADNLEGATQITFGEPIDGSIGTHGDADLFKFDARKDQNFAIHVLSNSEQEYASLVEVIDPKGNPEIIGRFSYATRTLWRPKVAGPHYVKVQADWDREVERILGDYTLKVELADFLDEHGDENTSATSISIGQTVQGSISCYGDRDVFRLQTEPGSAFRVKLSLPPELTVNTEIRDSFGHDPNTRRYFNPLHISPFIVPRTHWGPEWGHPECLTLEPTSQPRHERETTFQTWHGGEFYITLFGNRALGGDYSMTVETIEFEDFGNDRATAYDVSFGESINGSINIAGDYDVFRLATQHPQSFEIRWALESLANGCLYVMERESGDFRVEEEWCIYESSDPNAARDFDTVWTAPASGEYYLIASTFDGYDYGSYSTATGSYLFSIQPTEISDDHGNDYNQPTAVQSSVPVHGRIDNSDDVDVFAIEAEDGDVIRLTLNHDALDRVEVDLYDTIQGEYLWGTVEDVDWDLSQLDNDQTVQRIWRTVRAGTHYLVVKAASIGKYSVELTRTEYQDDFGNNPVDAHVITTSVEIEGEFEVVGDVDFFAFHAEVGEVYSMKVTSPTIERPQLNLLDAERTRLNPYFGNEFQWQAKSTGTFYIAAFVRRYDQDFGAYKLTFNRLQDDDHGYDLQTATHLKLDSITHGEMSWPDDTDFFKFEATEGEQYLIDLDRGGESGVALVLLDPEGEEIANEVHVDDIIWTAPVSGTHYVVVKPSWHRLARYSIIVTLSDYKDDHPDTYDDATLISPGDALDGMIAWRDQDWFRFDAEQGTTYYIDIERDTLFHSRAKIIYIDSPQTHIQELAWDSITLDDKTTRILFNPPGDGTYRIKLDANRDRGWGSYTIKLTAISGQ